MSYFLIVEDDAAVARSITRVIRPLGEPVLVTTAAAAHASIRARPWTALILDLVLPDGDGLDVLAGARGYRPFLPIMVLTGHLDALRVNAVHDAAAAYVCKPACPHRITRFVTHAATTFDTRLGLALEAWRARYHLSDAEADVLRRTALGESRPVIAAARTSSEETVKKQAANLLRLTQIDGTLQEAANRLLREMAGADR